MSDHRRSRPREPVSSYRLQLHAGFNFAQAADLVSYLAALGVTECYASPATRARPGSTHGYDVCDYTELSPELGGEAAYQRLCARLREHGLGQILDIVPNHMSADATANPWWHDVLQHGERSRYAHAFDIDWTSGQADLAGRVLLPVLADDLDVVLERGDLRLEWDVGGLAIRYGRRRFPVGPGQTALVLRSRHDEAGLAEGSGAEWDELDALLNLLGDEPAASGERLRMARERQAAAGRQLVELVGRSGAIGAHVTRRLGEINGTAGDGQGAARLRWLLDRLPYRLDNWRRALEAINYRRFFTISDLVGVRMEDPDVFERAHALISRLVREGAVSGLRVDHPDGLWDPGEYFVRLQAAMRHALGAAADDAVPIYVVVEKILSVDERLCEAWPVHGTTGYNFLNDLNGLFVRPDGALALVGVWHRACGRPLAFDDELLASKKLILTRQMAGELDALTRRLRPMADLAEGHEPIETDALRTALIEVIASLPVYRTYLTDGPPAERDRGIIAQAIDGARARLGSSAALACLGDVLAGTGRWSEGRLTESERQQRRLFVGRFQQVTAPVQAKGLEDTAFYRFPVLVSANEVGGDPRRPSRTPDEFHRASRRRLEEWPLEMTATATHDTKRGEDARARLNVLSEIPAEWERAVGEWRRINRPHRTSLESGMAPSPNAEYLFYQALVGAWPPEPEGPIPDSAPADLVERLCEYMHKATKESKLRTSWIAPETAYDEAVARFVGATLAGPRAAAFLEAFLPFERRVARAGLVNALAQLALKIASPGVPDFYQGTELWDFSLVDPDNRRPVDFGRRRRWLASLEPALARVDAILSAGRAPAAADDGALAGLVDALLAGPWDGRLKLFVTACGLRLRRRHADLCLRGAYVPLEIAGPAADHLVAFARTDGCGHTLIVAVPRLTEALVSARDPWPLGARCWEATRVLTPAVLRHDRYVHLLTGGVVPATGDRTSVWLAAADLFMACPVAVLWATE